MDPLDSIRLKGAALLVVLLLPLTGCKRESREATDALGSSLLFDNASPEVREALASPVDFRINDDNFARWEEARVRRHSRRRDSDLRDLSRHRSLGTGDPVPGRRLLVSRYLRDGSVRTLVKGPKYRISDPSWSPDGRWLSYDAKGEVWLVPAPGGTAHRVHEPGVLGIDARIVDEEREQLAIATELSDGARGALRRQGDR